MKQLPNIELLNQSLSQTKKAIVIIGANPNFDTVASALGFAVALRQKGIDTQVVSVADMRVEFSRLVGVDTVRKKVGNRNLVISFDYSEDRVEKVSYHISEDGTRFNLVVSPRSGAAPLQPESVSYEFAGAEAQFIATFGVGSGQELDELIKNEHGLMDGAMSLAITPFQVAPFAKCHLDASGLSSLSELTAVICLGLGLKLDEDSGSNLLAGIDLVTAGFRAPMTNADTYEVVAMLVRAGAVRPPIITAPPITPSQMPFVPTRSSFPQQNRFTQPPATQANTSQFAQMLSNSQSQPAPQPVPAPPAPQFPGEFKG